MRTLIVSTLISLSLVLSGCGEKDGGKVSAANTLVVKAGSELKDIEPLLPYIEKNTGVHLEMKYSGTIDAVESIQNGDAIDVAWLASNRYAMLVPEVKKRVVASERTMITPVVLGIKQSKAKELGWENNPDVTWKTIADAAAKGQFSFAMTSPSSSNTGFSGLLGLASALSGKGDALEERDIDVKRLNAFFKSQKLTAGSSGWLSDSYIAEQDKIDGIINYASTILSMNRDTRLHEKMTLIYPKDGILSSDYPIMLINAGKRESFDKVVGYIRGAEFQKLMTQTTLRRPVNPDVESADKTVATYVELSFPAKLSVVDAILTSFDNNLRLPTDSTFVLDVSGSMGGNRLDELKKSMSGLSGADSSISGRFARFRNRETIFLLPFSDHFGNPERFDMGNSANDNRNTIKRIAERVDGLQAGGGTALFEATRTAYMNAAQRKTTDAGKFYSIVLLTDGLSNNGISANEFAQWYRTLPDNQKGIRVFPVVFGEASSDELALIANLTGGKVFDSRKSGLQSIFKEIRGYQ